MLINRRNALMAGKRLPYDAEVEYLKSTGTQWIDTGYAYKVLPRVEMLLSQNLLGRDANVLGTLQRVAGCFQVNTQQYTSNCALWYRYGKTSNSLSLSLPNKINTFYECVFGRDVIIDGSTVGSVSGDVDFSTNNQNLLLFRAGDFQPCSIGYCKYYDGNLLVRDFIPVRFTNENGVTEGAMFDRFGVGGMNPDGSARDDGLYRNRGTGAFGYGNDI